MATATKAPMPVFTGRYAQIRKEFYKGIVLAKYNPERSKYKTEAGFRKAQIKKFNERMTEIDRIEAAGILLDATVTITWSKGGTYGPQAKATIQYTYMNRFGQTKFDIIAGDFTGGAGYDKASTAWANAANKCPEFMKLLMDARVKKKRIPFARLEIGEPYMPMYEGMVGIGANNDTMKALGYNVETINTYPSSMGVYKYTIKRKPTVRRS